MIGDCAMGDISLVAGAGGFIGQHLCRFLAELGMDVIGLDHRPFDMKYGLLKIVDLTNCELVIENLKGINPKWVFNLTGEIDHSLEWPTQRNIIDQHWLSVLNLVEALSKTHPESFVNIGSSDEYGDQPAPQSEDLRERPIAPYSAAKVAATHYLQMLYRRTGFPAIIARFFLVYGPGQGIERLIPWACTTLLQGKKIPTTPGLQKRDFLYVQDAVEGLVALASNPQANGKVFNVASGNPVTIKDVLEMLNKIIDKGGEIEFGARPMRQGEIMELYANTNRIQQVTGWKQKIPLQEGLNRTVIFMRDLGGIQ